MIKKNPRALVGCATAPGRAIRSIDRDPIDPTPRSTTADVRANAARRTPANRTREKPIEPPRAFTDRLRRRVVVVVVTSRSIGAPRPRSRTPSLEGFKSSVHLTSNHSLNTTTLAVSVANGNE